MCVEILAVYAHLEEDEPFTNLKTVICRKRFFQKLTQFPQGNNVLDDPFSTTHEFLSRDTCISSTHLNRPIWNAMSFAPF
jgi:hypothetical protein